VVKRQREKPAKLFPPEADKVAITGIFDKLETPSETGG
jgi:hypothetical protein